MPASALPRPPSHRRPLWLGVLLAPWAAPLALALLALLLDGTRGTARAATGFVEVLAFALAFGLPVAGAALLLVGLPATLWLRHRGRLAAWRLLLLAAPAGSLVLLAMLQAMGATLGLAAQWGLGAVMGLAVASVFCVACGIPWRARPD